MNLEQLALINGGMSGDCAYSIGGVLMGVVGMLSGFGWAAALSYGYAVAGLECSGSELYEMRGNGIGGPHM